MRQGKVNKVVSLALCVMLVLTFLLSVYPENAMATDEDTTAVTQTEDSISETSPEEDTEIQADIESAEASSVIDPDAVADEPTDYDSVKNPDNYVSQVTGEHIINGVGEMSGIEYQPEGYRWDGNADPDVINGEEFFTYDIVNPEDNPEVTEPVQILMNCDPMKASAVPESVEVSSEEELDAMVAETEDKITEVMEQTGYLEKAEDEKEDSADLWASLKESIFPTAEASYTTSVNGVQYTCTDTHYGETGTTGEYVKYIKTTNNNYPAYCMYPEGATTNASAGNFSRVIVLNSSNVRSQSGDLGEGYRQLQYLARVCYYGFNQFGTSNNSLLHLRAAAELIANNIQYKDGGSWHNLLNNSNGNSSRWQYSVNLFNQSNSLAKQIVSYCQNMYSNDGLEFHMVLMIPKSSSYQPMVGIYCQLKFQCRVQKSTGAGEAIQGVKFKLECLNDPSFSPKTLITDSKGVTDFTISAKYFNKTFRLTEISVPSGYLLDTTNQFINFIASPKSNSDKTTIYIDAAENQSSTNKSYYEYARWFHFRNNKGGYISLYKYGDTSFNKYTKVTTNGSTWKGSFNNEPLQGVVFEVKAAGDIHDAYGTVEYAAGTVVTTLTTDPEGHSTSKLLPIGTYIVSEKSVPDGFTRSSKTATVTINQDLINRGKPAEPWTKELPLVNSYEKGTFKLTKVDDKGEVLSGAKFGIYDENKNLLIEATTSSKGVISVTMMPLGTYYYKELEAPEGYKIVNTDYQKFSLTSKDSTYTKTVENVTEEESPPQSGKLKVVKTGDEFSLIEVDTDDPSVARGVWTQESLAGAKFSIVAAEDITNSSDGSTITKGTTCGTLTTSSAGTATSGDLTPGKYTVTETSAPSGYINSGASKTVTVQDGKTVSAWTSGSPLNNEAPSGNIEITKIDSTTQKPLSGVTFAFRKQGETTTYKLTTGNDGKVELIDVEPGTYEYWETSVPSGYVQDSSVRTITLTVGTTATANPVTAKATVGNAPGKIRVLKVNGKTQEPVQGVTFKFRKKGSTSVIATKTTNAKGIVELTGISSGTYEYYESSVPAGYVLDKTVHTVDFTVTGTETEPVIVEQTVTNIQKTVPLLLVKKGKDLSSLVIYEDGRAILEDYIPLEGVSFTLKAAENIYSGPTLMALEGDTIAKFTTDKDGKVTTADYYFRKASTTDTNALNLMTETSKSAVYDGLFQGEYSLYEEKSNANAAYDVSEDPTPLNVSFTIPSDEDNAKVESTENEDGELVDEIVYEGTKTGETTLVTANIYNSPELYPLRIRKVDSSTGEKLAGAEFKFYDSNRKELFTGTTNSKGEIYLDSLPAGTYYYQETKAPEGYALDNSMKEISVGPDTDYDKTDTDNILVVKNTSVRPFEFTKTDIVTSEGLPGATICIYDDEEELIYKNTTNSEGKVRIKSLMAGTYYYQEISAPDGFLIDTGRHEFVIDSNSDPVVKATLADKPVYGEVQIKKYGEDPTTSKMKISDSGDITYELTELAGARFKLIADETIKLYDASSQVFAKKGDTIAYFTTDEHGNGIIEGEGYYYRSLDSTITDATDLTTATSGTMSFEHALLGSYHLEEVTVPKGYRKCENKTVTLTDDHSNKEIMYSTVEFENILETGDLEITKTDTSSKMPVEGAVVTILNENKEVVTTGKTNKEGKIKFTRLPVGKYYYFESQAPEGYELDKTEHSFEIKLDTVTQCNFTDDTIYVLPGAGMSDNLFPIIATAFVILILVGQGIFVITRKKS